ncbi:MAG: methionine--tRNA ligase subunit beta [Planctomycetes bacterium]|nr:methionine--tRNA ligase subunit beta [Planctomycetota bacterium]NOG55154.1 methionine--tRNA ligase subunit beta [Planctomycetota bacterium]
MDPKPQITYDDFVKLDLLVATVKSAEAHPNADKLLLLQLDDGTEEGRQICAGIRQHYDPEELVGKQIIVVANLEPRKIRGEMSNGMLCAASDTCCEGETAKVVVLTPDKQVTPGSRVS